ncbi:MAG: ADP-ribosylglycohydrolase family protein [Clostridiales bacterium]|nr:ADP-ribosylglycohydrolase family protein [Clostridiales bacterium]
MDKAFASDTKISNVPAKDKIRGCLIGGAIGDALGYPVEFTSYDQILSQFGDSGITSYKLDSSSQVALISDDTQMSLFTANGLLYWSARSRVKGISSKPRHYVYLAYLDWLETQRGIEHGERICWICSERELWNCRAPGATCLDALSSGDQGSTEHRINHSKGCGGVMRVAPVGVFFRNGDDDEADMEGAQIAALTHSHSLGFMPAAFMTHVIKHLNAKGNTMTLSEIVEDAKNAVIRLFPERKHLGAFVDLIEKAILLSKNDRPDEENISSIGAGWCGDEAMAIAVYCSLKYQNSFSDAIIAAVNHSGDSDSTGSLVGSIVGSLVGYDAIEERWKQDLELRDTILEMADDLCYATTIGDGSDSFDENWLRKYS